MRVVYVWVVAGVLIFTAGSIWVMMTPPYKMIVNRINATIWNSLPASDVTEAQRVYRTLNTGFRVLPPAVILAILLWAYMNSQKEDVEQREYYTY